MQHIEGIADFRSSFAGPGYYQPGPNCHSTQVGYEVTLLLPFRANAADTDAQQPPYGLTYSYSIVKDGDSDAMVLVPIATAFQLVGLVAHIISTCVKTLIVGSVSASLAS